MRENKNNELKKNELEQVAGGGPLTELEDLSQELLTLSEKLVTACSALEQALEGVKLRIPGSRAAIIQHKNNVAQLEALISTKLKQRDMLIKKLEMI